MRRSSYEGLVVAASLLLVAVSTPRTTGAQASRLANGRILGVFDNATGLPMADVEVLDLATKTKTVTSTSGAATLAFLDAGVTVLAVRKVGYKEKMVPLSVSARDTESVTVLLEPLVRTLPAVRTSAPAVTIGKLSEFERRRALGIGHFLTADVLEKNGERQLAETLRLLPSLQMIYPPSGARIVAGGRNAQGPAGIQGTTRPVRCASAVMVDSTMVYNGSPGEPNFDVGAIITKDIAWRWNTTAVYRRCRWSTTQHG